MTIELENVSVSFDFPKTEVLKNLNFKINEREVVAMLGYSGAGKSTIIKIISSFIKPTTGKAKINGNEIEKGHPYKKLGYLCQSSEKMLFPWLTVEQNVLYSLKLRGELNPMTRKYCNGLIESLNLSHRTKSYPYKLSGGEQKRLSLAVVLSYQPDLLLLDEPFAGLDLELTKNLWDVLYKEFETEKPTVLFVTHSLDEAALLANRTVFITKSQTLLKDSMKAADFNIPLTFPRYELLNHPSVIAYKQHLLSLFNQSLNE